jgi:hypothetical protein
MSSAWYNESRITFLSSSVEAIADHLAGRAARENLDVAAEQATEWHQSVSLLQEHLNERLPVLRQALTAVGCEAIHDVILEFDFRRRGLRMDCLLLAEGALFVVEFKRSTLTRADRDQVMTYAVNLLEFHQATREWTERAGAIVVPVLALTTGKSATKVEWPGLGGHSWPALATKPLECDARSLSLAIQAGLSNRRAATTISASGWLASPFQPSSSIIDATLSLYGNHDVVAISDHQAPKAAIDASVKEIREHIEATLGRNEYRIIFLSGAPGAGKTLVGLDLVMRGPHAGEAVFVTGNAPLVEVLNKALSKSYRSQGKSDTWTLTGYHRQDAALLAGAATYKIVKAHNFLGKRGQVHHQADGRVLVFDEAQRTYEKGRMVLGTKLEDHEADLILRAQRAAYPTGGAVIVALIGHNQAINRGERGLVAWLDAAERQGWSISISDDTLALGGGNESLRLHSLPQRATLLHGHLKQSMRFYRNSAVEEWADAVLVGDVKRARQCAAKLERNSSTIWITRSLSDARSWARSLTVGEHRSGIIASGQARRLAAEGLFVDYKPDIATWMLAPSSDVRASTALETVQNQYQIQGLELDYTIVCWDADLRRVGDAWVAYKLNGSAWQRDQLTDIAKNGYRVILTRARRGMIVFVPSGDLAGDDDTRKPEFYDAIATFLLQAGAKPLDRQLS